MLNIIFASVVTSLVVYGVYKFFQHVVRVEFNWEYSTIDPDVRRNKYTSYVQGHSAELGRWADIDYLRTTTYDACYWLNTYDKEYFPK